MDLKKYYEKDIIISDFDGKTFYGFVDDYIYPEDNDNDKESIILKTKSGDLIEFTADDIAFIQEL